jgi:predicted RNA-binding Zn-ribbon protein involved in translation (DUF1610 family)
MSNIFCSDCAGRTLAINLLEQGVSKACPSCGLVYYGAKLIATSSSFSKETKEIAGVICGMLLLFTAAFYADKLIEKLA